MPRKRLKSLDELTSPSVMETPNTTAAVPVASKGKSKVMAKVHGLFNKVGRKAFLFMAFVLVGWMANVTFNVVTQKAPKTLPTYSHLDFQNNGFVGGTWMRMTYPFRDIVPDKHTSLITGHTDYYATINGKSFVYVDSTAKWVQFN